MFTALEERKGLSERGSLESLTNSFQMQGAGKILITANINFLCSQNSKLNFQNSTKNAKKKEETNWEYSQLPHSSKTLYNY